MARDCLPTPTEEPAHGSVVLVQSCTGTVYQRWFSDGLWHAPSLPGQRSPEALTWESLCRRSIVGAGPFLIHDAAEHEDHS